MNDLSLVAGTIKSFDAELAGDLETLATLLEVAPIVEWPPIGGEHDAQAVAFFRSALAADAGLAGWLAFYVCVESQLVGSAGFLGRPIAGVVEIGYSTCERYRGRGFATEAVRELKARAADAGVHTVVAHVKATNAASIVVLERNGFVRKKLEPDGRLAFALETLTA